jgi:hypothetical protein
MVRYKPAVMTQRHALCLNIALQGCRSHVDISATTTGGIANQEKALLCHGGHALSRLCETVLT